MKKSDLDLMIETLNDLKTISNRLDYNSSTAINKRIMTVLPILEKEYERMSEDKIEIHCPKLLILSAKDIPDKKVTLTDCTNNVMADLVNGGYKIIDFGIVTDSTGIFVYIKYTD